MNPKKPEKPEPKKPLPPYPKGRAYDTQNSYKGKGTCSAPTPTRL